MAARDDGAPVVREDPVGEGLHALDAVAVERLVARGLGEVHLRRVDLLEVRGVRDLVREGHGEGLPRRRDGVRVRVDGDLLQARQNDDLLLGVAAQPLLEGDDDGAERALKVAAHEHAAARLAEHERDGGVLLRRRRRLGQERREVLRLALAERVEGRVDEPAVELPGHKKVELNEERLGQAGEEPQRKLERRAVLALVKGLVPGGLAVAHEDDGAALHGGALEELEVLPRVRDGVPFLVLGLD
mmetsp:Transcript_40462/g.126614  ORF Transcript_40462/g.126614 Transcript_40462/m.126614 type:complete len:244 (+) Transcript_40462:277-1008(+)